MISSPAMEFSEDFSTTIDQTSSILKRKRTKRPRPSSSTSSAVTAGGEQFLHSLSVASSPTSSTGLSTTTEEEDIAASCLILLARGDSPPRAEEEIKSAERKTATATAASSRKFTEMSVSAEGKVGMYVYECKTCNRTFPSFQALGGHRASHKRPKIDSADLKKSPPPPQPLSQEEEKESTGVMGEKMTVMPLANRIGYLENSKSKVHECSMCGAQFGSGQALGGHMRRHRSALASAKLGTSSTDMDTDTLSREASEKSQSQNAFALDLNFPPEDDNKTSDESFRMFLADQQTRLVLSTAY